MKRNEIIPQKKNSLSESDRLQIAALLIKAGFAVRIGKKKDGGTTTYIIEYWVEED